MLSESETVLVVVGGSGFIGSAILREAQNEGVRAVPVSAPRLTLTSASVPTQLPAIDDLLIEELAAQIPASSVVVNAAGVSDAASSDVASLFGANAVLPAVVARAAARAGASRFIHISSAAVQGRGTLDETTRVSPFSPYSRSKALGEEWLREEDQDAIIVRPTSVQGPNREITRAVSKLAAGPLSSFAGRPRPTQQTHVGTVARSVLRLSSPAFSPPPIVLTPDEELTTQSFLRLLGGRKPRRVPAVLGRVAVAGLTLGGFIHPRLAAYSRRLEVLWFGQERSPGWFDLQPWRADILVAKSNWEELGTVARRGHYRPRVLFGVTSGVSVRGFFSGQHSFLQSRGWDVHLTCSTEGDPALFARTEGTTFIPLTANRRPSPRQDLSTLIELYRIVRRVRPTVAVWGSPKIGLLGPIVSRITGTPSVYVIHGLRLETTSGLLRFAMTISERVACAAATRVVTVGHELRERALELGLTRAAKISVIANGSANGIADPGDSLQSSGQNEIVGYVGRVTPDKGLHDLADAWPYVLESNPAAKLIIVGQVESDPDSKLLADRLVSLPGVELRGHAHDLRAVYRDLSVLVLPSYREGLPNVVLEAASHGVPCVTTTATGASEPVISGVTGLVVPTRAPDQLTRAINSILRDRECRDAMGASARRHVLDRYAQQALWEAWAELLEKVGR